MNKKGDIPTFFLLVIAILFIISSLFIFLTSDKNLIDVSREYALTMGGANFLEKYVGFAAEEIAKESITKYEKDGGDLKEIYKAIALKHEIKLQKGSTNFFEKIGNDDFKFDLANNKYEFSCDNLFVLSNVGNNKVRRSLNIVFNKNAEIKAIDLPNPALA